MANYILVVFEGTDARFVRHLGFYPTEEVAADRRKELGLGATATDGEWAAIMPPPEPAEAEHV